jgi:hypothetical protein
VQSQLRLCKNEVVDEVIGLLEKGLGCTLA